MVLQGNWRCKRTLFVQSVKVKKKVVVSNTSYSKGGFFCLFVLNNIAGRAVSKVCVYFYFSVTFHAAPESLTGYLVLIYGYPRIRFS